MLPVSRQHLTQGTTKYIHHRLNVRPTPATAGKAASSVQPCSVCTRALRATTVPRTPPPSVMITRRPCRSAMWRVCQGVGLRRSASTGPTNSRANNALGSRRNVEKRSPSRVRAYPAKLCATDRPDVLARRRGTAGSCRATSHQMITPTICTIVAIRNTQSSLSYADANHE